MSDISEFDQWWSQFPEVTDANWLTVARARAELAWEKQRGLRVGPFDQKWWSTTALVPPNNDADLRALVQKAWLECSNRFSRSCDEEFNRYVLPRLN